MKGFGIILFLSLVSQVAPRRSQSFRIGSLFMEEDLVLDKSFRQILTKINDDANYLNSTRIDYDVQYTKEDVYDAYQKACLELQHRVISIFGSTKPTVDTTVESVCSTLHIPYLTTARLKIADEFRRNAHGHFDLRLGPSQRDLVNAVVDVVQELGWTNVALITHRVSACLDAQLVVEMLQSRSSNGVVKKNVHVLDLRHNDVRMDLVNHLRNLGFKHFIVDIGGSLLANFFTQAMQSGIVYSGTSFLTPSLDLESLNVNDIRHTGASLLAFSTTRFDVLKSRLDAGELSPELAGKLGKNHKAALLFDGVHAFAVSVERLFETIDLSVPQVKCSDQEEPYELGQNIYDELHKVKVNGVTGLLSFSNGQRRVVEFRIIQLGPDGSFVSVGHWKRNGSADSRDVHIDDGAKLQLHEDNQNLKMPAGKLPLVVENLSVVIKGPDDESFGMEEFLQDLLQMLAGDLGFDYKLQLASAYGDIDPESGNWTGMIGKLVEREADVALADVTVTSERSQVVDFSPSLEVSELTVIVKKNAVGPSTTEIDFLAPFSGHMWGCISIAYVMVSLLIYVIGRVSPYERRACSVPRSKSDAVPKHYDRNGTDRSHVQNDPEIVDDKKSMSFPNSFWFALTGFLMKSTAVTPTATSTRFLTGFWWIFCIVILVSYFVGLAGFISSSGRSNEVTLERFLNQPDTELGVLHRGATHAFLKKSANPVHKRLLKKLDQTRKFPSFLSGIEAVTENDSFGFIVEGWRADRIVDRRCNELQALGDRKLGNRHYAVAFPRGSPYKDVISNRILTYQEDGSLQDLKTKWLSTTCVQDDGKTEAIRPGPFLWLFVILLFAGVFSFILAMLELIFYAFVKARQSRRERKSFQSIIKEELRQSLGCQHHETATNPNSELAAANASRDVFGSRAPSLGKRHGQKAVESSQLQSLMRQRHCDEGDEREDILEM